MATYNRIAFTDEWFTALRTRMVGDTDMFAEEPYKFCDDCWYGEHDVNTQTVYLENTTGMQIELHMYRDDDTGCVYPCVHVIRNFGDIVRLTPLRNYGTADLYTDRAHIVYNRTHDKLMIGSCGATENMYRFFDYHCAHMVELEYRRCEKLNDFSNEFRNMQTMWITSTKHDVTESAIATLELCGNEQLTAAQEIASLDTCRSEDGKVGIMCDTGVIDRTKCFAHAGITYIKTFTRTRFLHHTGWWPLTVYRYILLDRNGNLLRCTQELESERMPLCKLHAEDDLDHKVCTTTDWLTDKIILKQIHMTPGASMACELTDTDKQFVDTSAYKNNLHGAIEAVRTKMNGFIAQYNQFLELAAQHNLSKIVVSN